MSDDRTKPTFSTRLWSEEVGMADPGADFNRPPTLEYRFGNRTLVVDVNLTLYVPYPVDGADVDTRAGTSQVQGCAATLDAIQPGATTQQAQGSAAALAAFDAPVDASVMAAQAQAVSGGLVTAIDGVITYVVATSAQAQRAAASAATASAVSASTAQGQRSTAVSPVGSRASTRQAQSSSVGAFTVGPVSASVATRQAQRSVASVAVVTPSATLFVATTGSDSNPGTSVDAPLRTIQHAVTLAQAGAVVYVASGTYAETIYGTNNGTSTAPIRFISTTQWGARIVPPAANSTRDTAWDHRGDYVTIDGFEVDGTTDPVTGQFWKIGINVTGTNSLVTRCHVHHIHRNHDADSNGGAGILCDSYYGQNGASAARNLVHHIGPASGVGGSFVQGIYFSTAQAKIENNIVSNVTGYGFHGWHDVRNTKVTNNTSFHNGEGGFMVGGGDYVNQSGPCDYMVVTNNIAYGNTGYGFSEQGQNGAHNLWSNNLANGNGTDWSLNTSTHAADATGVPQFVNYQADGSGDYHLIAVGPATGAGLDTYAPAVDFDGLARSAPQDLGAFRHPVVIADAPAYATVWNAADKNNLVEAGQIHFDKPIADWVFEDPEYAENMGTIKVTQSTMKVTYGPHDFGAMLLSGDTYSAIAGKTRHTVIVNFKPTEDNWPNYPRQTGAARGGYRRGTRVMPSRTVSYGLSDTFMQPFVVTIHRADGSVMATLDMPRDHLPINSPELSDVPTATKPIRPHMHCASLLVWDSHDSRLNSYAHKYYPGCDERALRPHVAKTRVQFNPMAVMYSFTQENSMHHWYGMAKWSLPCNLAAVTADQAGRTDPYLWGIGPNDPNTAYNPWGTQQWANYFNVPQADYGHLDIALVLMTGWGYEPGSYSGHDYHHGPGGIRMDRVVLDSVYAIYLTNPNWIHLRDNTPITEMVRHWRQAEFNMAYHFFDGDIRDFASIPVVEHLAAKWTFGEVYYNAHLLTFTDLDHAIPQFAVENSPTAHYDEPHYGAFTDANFRMPWNGHSLDWLHNYGGAGTAALYDLSPAHAVSAKFRWIASGMAQAGQCNPASWWRSFMIRDFGWNMFQEAKMWKLASNHPLGVRQADIEARMETALNALYDNVYVPLEVNNSQTMYFKGLRNFGLSVMYYSGQWQWASWNLHYYLGQALQFWRQSGFWHRMFTRSDKCQKAMLMMLKLLDRGCFGYYLDVDCCYDSKQGLNMWVGDRTINSDTVELASSYADWVARGLYVKAPGESLVRNADGTKRYTEQGEFLRLQWPYIRRDYFPDYPAERDVGAVCAKVDQWVIDFHADIEVLYGVPGTERQQSGREWTIHPGCARILPPPVLGP